MIQCAGREGYDQGVTTPWEQHQPSGPASFDPLPVAAPPETADSALPAFRSLAFENIPRPDYADVIILPISPGSREVPTDPRVWAETIFSSRSMPPWVITLMGLRQAVVGLVGIKRGTPDTFDVVRVEGQEALLSTDESHLDFRCGVAFDVDTRLLRVTTVVRLKGWRGRLYFLPVRLLHPLVVNAMMARAIRTLAPA